MPRGGALRCEHPYPPHVGRTGGTGLSSCVTEDADIITMPRVEMATATSGEW